MRTIKFRGRNRQGKWLYGDLLHRDNESYILPEDALDSMNNYLVIPDTVGQFTGLLDKNGNEIYEGDVVSFVIDEHHFYGIIKWGSCRACFFIGDPTHSIRLPLCGSFELKETLEVIGNIHDNPELLNSL